MRPRLKVGYADFYPGFDFHGNYYTQLLSQRYDVQITDSDPDLLICSTYGWSHCRRACRKVCTIGENFRPDLNVFDYCLSFDHLDHPRHYRFPLAMSGNLERPHDWDAQQLLAQKTRFCNFVFSNPSCRRRNEFFHKLSRYKRVDSGGRCLNNMGSRVSNKREFQSQYKFSIAFENSSYPGYITEKILDAFLAGTVPIYWGNPLAQRDFNPRSFLNAHDYDSDEALIERVIELDQNDDLYLEYLSQPCYHDNRWPSRFRPEGVLSFFERIVASSARPVATRRGYLANAARYAARVENDRWSRRLRRWTYRAAHGLRAA